MRYRNVAMQLSCPFARCRFRCWTYEGLRKHIAAKEGMTCHCPAAQYAHDMDCPDRRKDGKLQPNHSMMLTLRNAERGHKESNHA